MLCDSACFLVILLGTALFFRDVVRIDLDNFSLYTHLWPSAFVLIAFNTLLHLYHGNILYPGAAVDPVEELRNTFYAVSLTFAVIFFYLSNEGASIIENAAHLGLPIPEKLKAVLEQLHDRAENEKEDE